MAEKGNGKDEQVPEKGNGKDEQVPEKAVEELPKAIVRRVVKQKLSDLVGDRDVSVLSEALQAFSEGARVFIHYLAATANDICKESNRQIINAEDIFKALEEIDFPELIEPLRASLEEFRENKAAKKLGSSKVSNTNKKSKRKESPANDDGPNKRQEVDSSGAVD